MTTVSKIIKAAYRESNLSPIGEEVTADQADEALDRLNVFIDSMIGNEAGEDLSNWQIPSVLTGTIPYTTSDHPPADARLICKLTAATTLYLPQYPQDGMRIGVIDISGNFGTYNLTLDANGYQIEGALTKVLATNGTNKEWLYRADLGSWQVVSPLGLFDEMPFPEKFDDLFITGLALRINPRYEQQTAGETIEAFKRGRTQFRAKYRQYKTALQPYTLMKVYPRYAKGAWTVSDAFNKGDVLWP